MRILAGRWKGRKLRTPKGLETRPILARVREAVFSLLAHDVEEARVADLFSGTGVIGLEALSRGAAEVDFFEAGQAHEVLRHNVTFLGAESQCRIHRAPLPKAIAEGPTWDLVFVDPPWGRGLGAPTLDALLRRGRLESSSLAILRQRRGQHEDEATWVERGFEVVDHRFYGDSSVIILRVLPTSGDSG